MFSLGPCSKITDTIPLHLVMDLRYNWDTIVWDTIADNL